MIVDLSEQAKADVARIDAWWRENRPEARHLFADELEVVIALLEVAPDAGEPYETLRNRRVRRALMPKTRHYAYHYIVNDDVLEIIAIWGTQRGDGPPLHDR